MNDYSFIGKEIKNIRKYHNMTQKELADSSNISEQTLRRCELGKIDTKLTTLANILDALNINVRKLFLDTNGSKLHEINNLFIELNYNLNCNYLKKASDIYENVKSFDLVKFEPYIQIEINANLKFYEALFLELCEKEYKLALVKYKESIEIYIKNYDINKFESFNYNQRSLNVLIKIADLMTKMNYNINKSSEILCFVYDILGDDSVTSNYLMYILAINNYISKNYEKSLEYTIKGINNSKRLFDMKYLDLLFHILSKIYYKIDEYDLAKHYEEKADILSKVICDSRDRLDYLDKHLESN